MDVPMFFAAFFGILLMLAWFGGVGTLIFWAIEGDGPISPRTCLLIVAFIVAFTGALIISTGHDSRRMPVDAERTERR